MYNNLSARSECGKKGFTLMIFASLILTLSALSASAQTSQTTVSGTVTDYKLVNPHTQIFFDVKDDNGKVEKWVAETNSAVALYRTGWSKTTLKLGDKITATGNRAMNGATLMHLRTILLNGQELPMGRQ